jgi:prostaglandin-endoperoxide synthase 2
MRATLVGAAVVTAVEAPAVYAFLRLHEDHFLPAAGCLALGELLETGISGAVVDRRLRRRYGELQDRPHEPGSARRHQQRLQRVLIGMSAAEIALWIAWVQVEEEVGWEAAGALLVVLMHLKHQAETSGVRGVRFSTGLPSGPLTAANLFETGGAIWALWLLGHGHPVQAAAALAGGLAAEHVILVHLLLREIEQRDIRQPRLPPARSPRSDRKLRIGEYLGENFPSWWRLVHRLRPLRTLFNRLVINGLVERGPYRPEPLSTKAPYTSWASLTDRTWSGRHLPPVKGNPGYPAVDDVAELFTRDAGTMTACPKSTLLFTCFAQWFVDGFLRTQRVDPAGQRDPRRNESPHQINLNTLYGLTDDMTEQLREHQGGRLKSQHIGGEEYPEYLCAGGDRKPQFQNLLLPLGFAEMRPEQKDQVFATGSDVRTLGFVGFNVLFLREHNRIAGELEERHDDWDDERLFDTARAILIMLLMKLVVNEYINHINAYHFRFELIPNLFERAPWHRPNWMSVEFNLLYRWHSLVPPTIRLGDDELTVEQSLVATPQLTAAGLGKFMHDMSDQPAGRIGLFNTDPYLVGVAEMPSIEQARIAKLRPYNEYRELFGFPRLTRFEEFSSSQRTQNGLRRVYERVDNVELFAGLFAEEAGPNSVLPPLMTVMVAFDAFSQLLTNPLVAPRIYNDETFSELGTEILGETTSIADVARRNVPGEVDRVSLTRSDYVRV